MDLRIQTLGGLRIFRGEEELTRLVAQPVRAALLVYLAVEREATRDRVQSVLWSRLPPDRARHSLSQALYLLRKELGEGWITSEGERLRVSATVSVDARDVETLVDAGAPDRALELYHGEFLEGWHLRETPDFEQWMDRTRLRLARVHRDACRGRLAELRGLDRPSSALAIARDWAARDPLEDEAHQALIDLLARLGRRDEALEHFDRYRQLLAAEDLTPLEDIEAMVARIRAGDYPVEIRKPDPPPVLTPLPARSRRYVAAALLLVVPLGLLLVWALGGGGAAVPEGDPSRVLVFPLENRTGDPALDPVGRLAADWITQGLASADFLTVVPSGELLPAPAEPDEGLASDALTQARAAAADTRSGLLVTGAYYESGEGLAFQVQILVGPDWEVLESVGPVRTAGPDPMEAVEILRQRVLVGVALHRDQRLAGGFVESQQPPSYEAYLAFLEGFQKFVRGDWSGAAEDLTRAHEISPEFTAPLIIAAGANVMGLRDYHRADSLLRIVEASRDQLPTYDQLRLDLVRSTLDGDNRRGFEAAKQAAAIVPGGTAHYGAGQRAVELNRPREALEILGSWDPSRPGARSWTPYWDAITQAHHLLGDHRRELEAALEAREAIPGRLETLWVELRARAALGEVSEVERLVEESLGLQGSPILDEGQTMVAAVEELRVHGHFEVAEGVLTRFDAWFQELAPEEQMRGERQALLGRALYLEGRLEEAREVFAALNERAPDDPDPIRFLGTIAARAGDTARAEEWLRTLLERDPTWRYGSLSLAAAAIAARLGKPEQALVLLRRAVARGLNFGTQLHTDPDLAVLRDYEPFREFMRPEG